MKRNVFVMLIFFVFLIAITQQSHAYSYTYEPHELTFSEYAGEIVKEINLTFSFAENESVFIDPLIYMPFFDSTINPPHRFSAFEDNTPYPIVIKINVPSNFPAGSYEGFVKFIVNSTDVIEIPISFTLLPKDNLIISDDININATTGDEIETYFTIKNNGNKDVNINVSSSNENLCNASQNEFMIFRGVETKIPIFCSVPENEIGQLKATISFNDENRTITINVNDTIKPSIEPSYIKEKYEIFKYEPIEFNITDNVAIDYAYIEICDERHNLTRRGLFYSYDFTPNRTGTCKIYVYANDTSGNYYGYLTDVEIISLSNSSVIETLVFPKLKPQQSYTKEFAFLEDETTFQIKLTNFQFEPLNENISITNMTSSDLITTRILFYGGTADLEENVEKTINSLGSIKMMVIGKVKGKYSGLLKLTFPQGVLDKTEYSVLFEGTIEDYSVTPSYNGYVAGKRIICNPIDAGTYENSTYKCTIDYPIDVGIENLEIPVSDSYIKDIRRGLEIERDLEAKRADGNWNLFLGYFIISLIIYGFVIYQMKIKGKTLGM